MIAPGREIEVAADRVALGRIGKAHGVHGAFRVWPYADDLDRFAALKSVTLSRGAKSVTAHVESVTIAAGFAIIQTDAIRSPEEVQIWLGGDLEIELSERVVLPEGRYFHDQIIGLKVETVAGEKVGIVVQVIDGPANDVYVCRSEDNEYMIPAVAEFVKSVDIKNGKMIIDPIPGMID